MKTNLDPTKTYRRIDFLIEGALRCLAPVLRLENLARPIWNRWRAAGIDDQTIKRFLQSIYRLSDWGPAAIQFTDQEGRAINQNGNVSRELRVEALRRLSALCWLGAWGVFDPKQQELRFELHRRSRDYYIAAETLCFGARYRRIALPWPGGDCFANLHLPPMTASPPKLVVICHGVDDVKEEHLMTELALINAGYAVITPDGPGQGEALFYQHLNWPADFERIATVAINTAIRECGCDADQAGCAGISWGGLWALRASAIDPRVKAVFDLGGPTSARNFRFLPYLLKARFVQAVGEDDPEKLQELASGFSIENDSILGRVQCPVRIVHGARDPLVTTKDKEWLRGRLLTMHPHQDVSLVIHPDGDHCCTGQGAQVRTDAVEFFHRVLKNPAQSL